LNAEPGGTQLPLGYFKRVIYFADPQNNSNQSNTKQICFTTYLQVSV